MGIGLSMEPNGKDKVGCSIRKWLQRNIITPEPTLRVVRVKAAAGSGRCSCYFLLFPLNHSSTKPSEKLVAVLVDILGLSPGEEDIYK